MSVRTSESGANVMQAVQRAMTLHQSGQLVEAEKLYRSILATNPDHFEALHFLGVLQAQQGRLQEAEALMARSLQRNTTVPDAFVNYARVLHSLKRPEDAIRNSDRALAINPRMPGALIIRCNALRDLGRHDEALAAIQNARALDPNNPVILAALGDMLWSLKRPNDALTAYQQAIKLNPNDTEMWCRCGILLNELKRANEALSAFDRAIALKADQAEAWRGRAKALHFLQRHEEAAQSDARAIALRRDYKDAWSGRTLSLHLLGRHQEAIECCRQWLALDPNSADANCGMGACLEAADRLEEALEYFDRALAINPTHADALLNRGETLHFLGRMQESLDNAKRALAINPEWPSIHWNESFVRLLLGDFKLGLQKYEWRWRAPTNSGIKPPVNAADWQGEDLAGRRMLIYTEQGMGDTIQFSRYLPMLAKRGGELTFYCDARLIRLIQPLLGDIKLVHQVAVGAKYDYRCPLLSLPLHFKTDLNPIPAPIPYPHAEPELIERWRRRIGLEGFKVGIMWQGNPRGKVDRGRSIPLAQFHPLARIPGVRMISLQKHHGLEQLANWPPDVRIEDLGAELDNGPHWFLDSAAAIMNLDLLISSDTSMVHLSGALGQRTWAALKFMPDWRWMLGREDSQWYPTMRLFRQTRRGDWPSVFEPMECELRNLVAERSASRPT